MKQFLILILMSFSTYLFCSVAQAEPPAQGNFSPNFAHRFDADDTIHGPDNIRPNFHNNLFENLQERRRQREELGFRRLKEMKWQKGYTMPQHYRGDSYKVDYTNYNLPRPERNQQWYKVNNDYLLIDSSNNTIVDSK
ncbi:RcnB family protein [Acinetobacter sp. MD2]|uniref:RcnB family protein n=1 Tax=Acinetobacter sp. MD2 TaxID=2600066 RepID=UPI002D1E6273|nr:RcnB family protein [Acinetobacter sp. MD2]MEB3767375.1 RcnB family protein [Acinetobacter sp. MD2]